MRLRAIQAALLLGSIVSPIASQTDASARSADVEDVFTESANPNFGPLGDGPSSQGHTGGAGFLLIMDSRALDANGFRIRLVESGSGPEHVENLRDEVVAAANQIAQVTGISMSVEPGRVLHPNHAQLATGDSEILVVVSNAAEPCATITWDGCGSPWDDRSSHLSRVPYLAGGRVWIRPSAVNNARIQRLVNHEFGHALGLAHFNAQFNGAFQVMAQTDVCTPNCPTDFQAGDQNGLRYERDTGRMDFLAYGNLLSRSFTGTTAFEASGTYSIFSGNFDGDGASDLALREGTAVHVKYGQGNRTFWPTNTFTIGGSPTPVAGDFNGDGNHDIFWFGYAGATDTLWWGNDDRTFSTAFSLEAGGNYRPFAGDFDRDGFDDIFFYGPGGEVDSIRWGSPLTRSLGQWTFSTQLGPITGDYEPVAGDFDGDLADDIFWYFRAGEGDSIWWGGPLARGGTFDGTSQSNSGNYDLDAGDFDGDGRFDLLYHAIDGDYDAIRWGQLGRTFVTTDIALPRVFFTHVTGDFDGDRRWDVIGYRPG